MTLVKRGLKYFTFFLAILAFFHLLYGTEASYLHAHGQSIKTSSHAVISMAADNDLCLICEIASVKLIESAPQRQLECVFSATESFVFYNKSISSLKLIIRNYGRAPPVALFFS